MNKHDLTIVIMKDAPKTASEAIRRKQGEKIRRYRKVQLLSQAALAEKIGVTKAAVSDWETGGSTPRQHLQIAIARELNAPWFALFGLDEGAA